MKTKLLFVRYEDLSFFCEGCSAHFRVLSLEMHATAPFAEWQKAREEITRLSVLFAQNSVQSRRILDKFPGCTQELDALRRAIAAFVESAPVVNIMTAAIANALLKAVELRTKALSECTQEQ
jgi:hypothetical protein